MDNVELGNFSGNRVVEEVQDSDILQNEFMLLGLRMIDGVSIQDFKNKFGVNPLYVFSSRLNKLVETGLVCVDGDNIRLTNKGLDLANQVWMEFS